MSGLKLSTAHRLRPMEGLYACGDAVVEAEAPGWHCLAVVDALGHGPDAELSALAAHKAVLAAAGRPLEQVFAAVDAAVVRQRGVVMSAILVEGGVATFAGVGNVELFAPEGVARPPTMAGTLGTGRYRYRAFALPLAAGQRWVLASDGIKAREGAALLAGLRAAGPGEVADALIDRATRPHDDASVLVCDVEASP